MKKKTTLPISSPLVGTSEKKQPAKLPRGAQLITPESYEDEPEPDLDGQAEERVKAFSARYQFAGTELKPFSITRKRFLMDIRASCGAGEFGRFDALLADALRFTWLCLQDGHQLDRFQAGVGLPGLSSWPLYRRFQMAIDRWSEANEAVIITKQAEIINIFFEAWQDSEATHAVPESADHNEEDPDAGN